MSLSSIKSASSSMATQIAGKVGAHAGEADQSFSLRDTLSAITVRETSFGEFLAALKQSGRAAAKH